MLLGCSGIFLLTVGRERNRYTQPHKDFPLGGRFQSVTLCVLRKINVRSSIFAQVTGEYPALREGIHCLNTQAKEKNSIRQPSRSPLCACMHTLANFILRKLATTEGYEKDKASKKLAGWAIVSLLYPVLFQELHSRLHWTSFHTQQRSKKSPHSFVAVRDRLATAL